MNMQWAGQIDMSNRLICVVQDKNICQLDNMGNPSVIGYTQSYVDELFSVVQEYKKLCIENGLIEEEKTPEQVQAELMATISEQNKAMQEMMAMMMEMQGKVEVLEDGRNSNDSTSSKGTWYRPKKADKRSQSGETILDEHTEPEPSE